MTTAPDLRLQGVTVRYGSTIAVDGVDLQIRAGEIVALLGPSGSGKSSLLRAVAGLEPVAAGGLLWRGQSIVDIPTHRRGFGLMFQDGQLFPHRDVAGNVAYGIRALPRAERAQRVREVLDVVGMGEYASRSVSSLSGGQAQRVALARSLAPRPELLLLDEPLSALDRSLRERLSSEIRQILRECGASCIYVTHDQDEAFAVADRIGVMIDGRLAALAAPQELWASPGRRDVAQFLGFGPFIPVGEGRWRALAPASVRVRRVIDEGEAGALTSEVELEEMTAAAGQAGAILHPVGVIVDARGGRGHSLVEVRMGDKTLKARALPNLGAASDLVGALVELEVDLSGCPVVV